MIVVSSGAISAVKTIEVSSLDLRKHWTYRFIFRGQVSGDGATEFLMQLNGITAVTSYMTIVNSTRWNGSAEALANFHYNTSAGAVLGFSYDDLQSHLFTDVTIKRGRIGSLVDFAVLSVFGKVADGKFYSWMSTSHMPDVNIDVISLKLLLSNAGLTYTGDYWLLREAIEDTRP